MKKFIGFLILIVLTVSLLGASAYDIKWGNQRTYSKLPGNTLRAWAEGVQDHLGPGTTFFVDGNKSTAGDGSSWGEAFTTLSAALAASHADIAVTADRQWASRNTIYCMGDTLTEDLVLLAQKTDIIGVGNNNPYNKCALVGNHVIPSTTATPSCRFYNMQFYGDAASPVFDITSQAGLEFHGCLFQANGSATIGLELNNCSFLVVADSEFGSPDGVNFSASAIKVEAHTTNAVNIKIRNNIIQSGGIGIDWDETITANCWITDNYIYSTGLVIDDEGDDIFAVNNRFITAVDTDTPGNGYDGNAKLWSGNLLTGSGTLGEDSVPPRN